MWGNYGSYLDYLELRRRVEKRLMPSFWLLIHTALFALWTPIWLAIYTDRTSARDGFVSQPMAQFMMVWSIVLLAHGLWTWLRSGAWAGARSRAIEREMRDVALDDTFFAQDERDLFRLHGMLDEDIRSRANNVLVLVAFTFINAINWIGSGGGHMTSYPWQITPFLAVVVLLPVLIFNLSRSERKTRHLTQIMTSGETAPKAKRTHQPEFMYLTDEGEALEIIEDDEKPKRAFRG